MGVRDVSVVSQQELTICAVSDANYATGLRVSVFSALAGLAHPARIVVIDAGLDDPEEWRRSIERHSRCSRCDVVAGDLAGLEGRVNVARFSRATWMRLLLPELLPEIDRLIYIDCDVLVRGDFHQLWGTDMKGADVAAVRDFFHPTFATGVPHAVAALGAQPDTPYYNSGVMILDLAGWRRDDFSRQAVAYAVEHGDALHFADQDAINLVAAGRICELSPKWNVQVGALSTREITEYNAEHGLAVNARELKREARVIHFTHFKPWQTEGVRASWWSLRLQIEFARSAARFSERSRAHQLSVGGRWGAAFARRCWRAVVRRLAARVGTHRHEREEADLSEAEDVQRGPVAP